MSAVVDEDVIVTYVRRSLGEPTVEVELDNETIKEMIPQAVGIYGTYKPVEKLGSISVLAGQQKYSLTADQVGKGIIEHFRPDPMDTPTSLEEFDVFRYHSFFPNLDPGDYMMERVWWKAVKVSGGADEDLLVHIDPTDGSATVYVSPSPAESYNLVYIYVVDPTLSEVPASDDDWIKDYVLAMCMEVLGRIRSKFRGVTGAEGSIDMDGEELKQKGSEMREQMEEYLKDRGQVIAPIRG